MKGGGDELCQELRFKLTKEGKELHEEDNLDYLGREVDGLGIPKQG